MLDKVINSLMVFDKYISSLVMLDIKSILTQSIDLFNGQIKYCIKV